MILLKTGWLQNAVTVKVPFQGMTAFGNTLSISGKDHVLKAEISFDSPETIREAILFRNDKPLAAFGRDAAEGILLNLATDFTKGCNYKLVFKDAKLLRSRRMFTDPNDPLFRVTPTEVVSKRNLTYHQAAFLFAVGGSFSILALSLSGKINLISLGDEAAIGLGVAPEKVKRKTVLCIIPICAVCVAAAGNIGFVGLFVPHIIRKLNGNDYRKLMPLSFLYGSVILVLADIAARTILAPYELPIGLFTACIGVPVFLWLVRKEKK